MIPRRLAGLVHNDRDTRVAVAVAWLHVLEPPVTTGKIDRYLDMPRRNVERAVSELADAGLVEVHPGHPRTIVPLVAIVPWEEPTDRSRDLPARLALVRSTPGPCPHRLTDRWDRLCIACGEVMDWGTGSGVGSTAV